MKSFFDDELAQELITKCLNSSDFKSLFARAFPDTKLNDHEAILKRLVELDLIYELESRISNDFDRPNYMERNVAYITYRLAALVLCKGILEAVKLKPLEVTVPVEYPSKYNLRTQAKLRTYGPQCYADKAGLSLWLVDEDCARTGVVVTEFLQALDIEQLNWYGYSVLDTPVLELPLLCYTFGKSVGGSDPGEVIIYANVASDATWMPMSKITRDFIKHRFAKVELTK